MTLGGDWNSFSQVFNKKRVFFTNPSVNHPNSHSPILRSSPFFFTEYSTYPLKSSPVRLNKSYTHQTTTTTTTYHQSASFFEQKQDVTISRDISVSAKRDLAKRKKQAETGQNSDENDRNFEHDFGDQNKKGKKFKNKKSRRDSRLFMLDQGDVGHEDRITIKEPDQTKDNACNFNFGKLGGLVNYGTDFDFGLDEIDKQLTSFRSNDIFESECVKPVTLRDVSLTDFDVRKEAKSDENRLRSAVNSGSSRKTVSSVDSSCKNSRSHCKNLEMSDIEIPPAPENKQRYSSSSFDSVPLPPPSLITKIRNAPVSEESISDFDSSRSSSSTESIDGAILSLQQRIKKFNDT